MKHRRLIICIVLSLTACGTGMFQPTPTATDTPAPTLTPTSALTNTPTETPSPTSDPNRPAGATRFENGTYYKDGKDEFGRPVTYEWVPVRFAGDPENVEGHWFGDHGGFPGMEKNMYQANNSDEYVPVWFEMLDGLDGPKIKYEYDSSRSQSPTFSSHVIGGLSEVYYQQYFHRKQRAGEYGLFYQALITSQGATIKYHTKYEDFNATFSKSTGFIIRVVDIETAKQDSRFQKLGSMFSNANFYVMITGDEKGNVVSYTASDRSVTTLSPQDFRQMILAPIAIVSIGSNLEDTYTAKYAKLYTNWSSLVAKAGKGLHPVIGIEYPPEQPPTPTATP